MLLISSQKARTRSSIRSRISSRISMRRTALVIIVIFIAISLSLLLSQRSKRLPPLISNATQDQTALYNYWSADIKLKGATSSYKELVIALKPIKSRDTQHDNAHIFGQALFDTLGTSSVSVCDDSFRYGCIHALIERSILVNGVPEASRLSTWCDSPENTNVEQCRHGIGHGLTAYFGNTEDGVAKALELCSKVETARLNSCEQGVFMEYYNRFWQSERKDTRPISENDPLSFCKQLPSRYAFMCGYASVQWWLYSLAAHFTANESYAQLGNYCSYARNDIAMLQGCFEGIGAQAVQSAQFVAAETRNLCENTQGTAISVQNCFKGAINQYESTTRPDTVCWAKLLTSDAAVLCN